MSYSTRNGKLEKKMPEDKEVVKTLRFHVIASVAVRVDAEGKVVDAQLSHSRLTTKPEDKMSKEQLAHMLGNSDELTKLAGVMLVEQIHRKQNPVLTVPAEKV